MERRDFLEICDNRCGRRSTILTSPLPVTSWHQQTATRRSPTASDRLVHNAHRIDLAGESIQTTKGRGQLEGRS